MRFRLIMVLAALCGCDSPSVSMLGGTVQDVTISGSRFRVYMQPGGNKVEAHRVSVEPLPSLVTTFERAYRAIEQASGCGVMPGSLRGDQAIILAELDSSSC